MKAPLMGVRMARFRGTAIVGLSLAATLWTSPASAWLSASRTWIGFPDTKVGDSWTDYVHIRNSGADAAEGLAVTDDCFMDFSLVHNCFFNLPAGQSCSIAIRYQPTRAGAHVCSIAVSSSNKGAVSISVGGRSR